MTKEIEAVYEQGMIRPLQPLQLPDGTRLDLIVITHDPQKSNGNAAEILAEIAVLPLEVQVTPVRAANTIRFYLRENKG